MEMKKMMKTAGVLNKLFKFLQWLMVIGMAVAVMIISVLTIINWVSPGTVLGKDIATVVQMGFLNLTVDSQYAPDTSGILTFCWILLALVSTNAAVLWFTFKYIREILEPMQNGNPFHKNTAGNIKKLAWIQLAMGIIGNVVQTIAAHVAADQWHLMEFGNIKGIQKASIHVEGDLNFVLIFFGLLLLSYIFNYGASLQQLSDETL